MEVEYSFPGTIKVVLGPEDLASVSTQGFCVDRQGFSGINSKVWVRDERESNRAYAHIDRGGDLYVHIPSNQGYRWRCEVPRADITAEQVEMISHYLGESGVVIVEWGDSNQ